MSAREVELYRAGLLDAVRKRPRLTLILKWAQETDLMLAYAAGLIAGRKLLKGV
jgi:hypothetical protein